MILFKKSIELRNWLETQSKNHKTTGFVPTMGALHRGHISLINQSKKSNDITVCSIFVNPTQFNDPKDFEKYPVTLEKDIDLLLGVETDVLFLPSVDEMYPANGKKRHYDLGYLETILEGEFRPGHFQGVCMIVHRLLDIVRPDVLYLGQKDFQQCMVISKLIELISIQDKTAVEIVPTLRESDGLAMSSRNMRFNDADRKQAIVIYQTLQYIKENIRPGNLPSLKENAKQKLISAGFKPDYVEFATADGLKIINEWDEKQDIVVLVAAFLNEVRLIDNLLLTARYKL